MPRTKKAIKRRRIARTKKRGGGIFGFGKKNPLSSVPPNIPKSNLYASNNVQIKNPNIGICTKEMKDLIVIAFEYLLADRKIAEEYKGQVSFPVTDKEIKSGNYFTSRMIYFNEFVNNNDENTNIASRRVPYLASFFLNFLKKLYPNSINKKMTPCFYQVKNVLDKLELNINDIKQFPEDQDIETYINYLNEKYGFSEKHLKVLRDVFELNA